MTFLLFYEERSADDENEKARREMELMIPSSPTRCYVCAYTKKSLPFRFDLCINKAPRLQGGVHLEKLRGMLYTKPAAVAGLSCACRR